MKLKALRVILLCAAAVSFCFPASAGGKKDVPQESQEDGALSDGQTVVSEQEEYDTVSAPHGNDAAAAPDPRAVKVGVPGGSAAVPAARMMDGAVSVGGRAVSFERFDSAPELLQKMLDGGLDVCLLATVSAARAYNASAGGVVCAGVSENGSLSLLTKDVSVRNFSDLLGRRVFVAGADSAAEYIFRWLLEKNGIPADGGVGGILIDSSVSASSLVPRLLSGKIQYAVTAEPFTSVAMMKSGDVRAAIDFQSEFAAVEGNGASYPFTLIVMTRDFADSEPETARAFLRAYRESAEWTKANPQKAGVLVQKKSLGLMAPVAAASIPRAGFTYESAPSARERIETLLGIFMRFDPDAIGGTLPRDDFYFE